MPLQIKTKIIPTKLIVNNSYEGETIETKIRRIVNNKEPIHDGAPLVYTERNEGVKPEYNIRTDRWEIAVDAMDAVTRTEIAKREQLIGEKTYDTMNDTQKDEFHKKYPNSKLKPKNETKPESGA